MTAERDPQAPEIRAWGVEHGWEIKEHGRIPAALRSAWATATSGGATQLREAAANGNGHHDDGPVTFTVPDYLPPDAGAAPAYDGDGPRDAGASPEQAPVEPPRQSWRERLNDRVRSRRQAGPGRRRRVTLETLGGLAWAGAAQLCASKGGGRWLPVANVMAFQAPVAGMVAEDALKGTIADAVLQPVARMVESGSTLGSLVGPPALVGLVCARPELYPVARPLLAIAMKEWVVTAGPKLRELRRREERYQAEMAEMGEEFDLDIDGMIDAVFAPMFAQAQPAPEGAAGAAAG